MKFIQPFWSWLRVRTPRPPYDQQHYWDKVYFDTMGSTIEWGQIMTEDLIRYQWSEPEGDFFMRAKKQGRLEEHVGKDDSIMMLGCGNSAMGDDLRVAGWRGKITSVDFAQQSISQAEMRAQAKGLANMDFITADVRKLHEHVPASSYDVALDKGLLDAIYCSRDSDESVKATKAAVLRLLKPGGRWVCLMNAGFFGQIPPNEVNALMEDRRFVASPVSNSLRTRGSTCSLLQAYAACKLTGNRRNVMGCPSWSSMEVRRLAPIDSGILLYIWTKMGSPVSKKAHRG